MVKGNYEGLGLLTLADVKCGVIIGLISGAATQYYWLTMALFDINEKNRY